MKRALRWLKRGLLALGALVVVGVAFALIAVHTDWGRDLVRRQVEGILASSFPGGATIGRIDGSPFGTLVVSNVVLLGPDKLPLVSVERLEVEASLTPLLGKTARVDRLVATGVVITNPRAPEPPDDEPPSPSPWTVELPRVEIRGAALHLDGAEPVDLVDLHAVAAIRIAPMTGELSLIATLRARWAQRGVDLAGIASAVIGDDIVVPALTLGAGGATVVVANGRMNAPAGVVVATATPASVEALIPGLRIPASTWIRIDLSTAPPLSPASLLAARPPSAAAAGTTTANVTSALGSARLEGRIVGDVAQLSAHGVMSATDVDLAVATRGAAIGRGTAIVGFTVNARDGARGTLVVSTGEVAAPTVRRSRPSIADDAPLSVPSVHAIVAFDAMPERARALVVASAEGRARLGLIGGVRMHGDALVVEQTHVGAVVPDLWLASAGLAPVRGSLTLQATAGGEVGRDLRVEGMFGGRRLRLDTIGIDRTRGTFSSTLGPTVALDATVTATRITNAGAPIGDASVTARTRADGRIAVVANVAPAMAPLGARLSAIVALPTDGGVIDIELERHRVALPEATWAGTGGRVRIDDRAIVVTGFRSRSGAARLAASARIGRGTTMLSAKLDATDVALAKLDPTLRGTVDAHLELTRRGIAWKGGGTVTVHGIAADDQALPLDGTLDLDVDGRRVKLAVRASNPSTGGARLAVEVDGPRDLTDVAGWKRVARADLHAVTVGLDAVNAGAVTGDRVLGVFDGTIEIREGVPDGKLRVRGVPTPYGAASGDLTVALDDVGALDVHGEVSIGTAGDASLDARIVIPDRPFDVEAYKRLGKNVVSSASVKTSEIVIDAAKLAALGIFSPYTGTAIASLDVGPGGSSIEARIEARGVTGGALRAPLDATVGVRVDDTQTAATLRVGTGVTTIAETTNVRVPMSLDRWIAFAAAIAPNTALVLPAEPLAGTLAIPLTQLRTLLAVVGRDDLVRGGTLRGEVALGGTLRAPTASGTIDLADIAVVPRLTGTPPPVLRGLHLTASWDTKLLRAKVTGEAAGAKPTDTGTLLVDVAANPAKLAAATGLVQIKNFELATVAVFLPGMLVGARGTLDTELKLSGLDVTRGTVRGFLAIRSLRLPFTPLLSPLRSGALRVDLTDDGIVAKLDGKLGGEDSTIAVTLTSDPRGVDTAVAAEIKKLTPISFLQPQITGNVWGTLHREGLFWTGKLTVSRGLVFIPEGRGNELLDDVLPDDIVFVGGSAIVPTPERTREPQRPFLVVDVDLKPTQIELPSFVIPTIVDLPFLEDGLMTATGSLRLSVGDTVGLDGELRVDRGQLSILGRKYEVERAQVAFDGTIDPLFDVKLTHEFPDVTTGVRVAGRLSEIDTLEPEFTSDPNTYSQSQLFGYFLGGTPGGDVDKQGQDALVGAGTALTFGVLTAVAKNKLGRFKPDVFRCDPATSTTNTSCVTGKYFGKRSQGFLSYRYRLTPRLDENQNELRLEYTLRRSLTLELSGGDGGIFGLDLLRRRRF